MDNASAEHYALMQRLLKYVIQNKDKSIQIYKKHPGKLNITAYSDSNYTNDKDSCQSVTGFVIYVNDTLVTWKSKMQPAVTLSSTESEYVALSMCLCEMIFIKHIIEELHLDLHHPMILYCDNTGTINLCHNYTTSGRTLHVDIRWHS